MITKLDQLIGAVKERNKKARLVVAYAQDKHSMEAVVEAHKQGIIDPILVGERAEIMRVAEEIGADLSSFIIQEEKSDVASVARAVQMIHNKEADILMKGLVSTDKYMKGILNKESGLVPPKATLTHIALLQIPAYHKLLMISDVAIIVQPTLNQKITQVGYLRDTAHALGIEDPKIAILSATEQVLHNIPSCYDAAIISTMGRRNQIQGCTVDGPLALDVAINSESVKIKKLDSPVGGDADCLIFPALESANIFFKGATNFMGAEIAGMVVGGKVPCVLTSRGDSPQSKLYSIALAALTAK